MQNVGVSLFGAGRWQAPLAKELEWSQSLIARIMKGERPLTDEKRNDWRHKLASVIRPRIAEAMTAIDREIERTSKGAA